MSSEASLAPVLDTWRQRWPEWAFGERFVPPDQRQRVLAWFALLQQFEDIMNIAGDTLPADAKLAWWQQELCDWDRRRSRHPLGRLLESVQAPWGELAHALPIIQIARNRPESFEQAMGILLPFAAAVVAVERVMSSGKAVCEDTGAVSVQWWYVRGGAAARTHPVGMDALQWKARLLREWPTRPALARPHRIWSRLARLRLQRECAGKLAYAPPLQQLWHSWRAASGRE